MKKLPIGLQTFSNIINENYLYIDKTKEALELIENCKYSFLSRPRRFGKSLLMDTIQEIFEGNKELFKGLYIYDKWDFNVKYPVIKIDFFGDLRSEEALKRNIFNMLRHNQERLEVECFSTDDFSGCMEDLIKNTHKKYNQPVVVLIDEYDKAILDNLDQMEVAKENREIIKSLYSILKGSDKYIKFVLLTGVSKFSKASIFSGLNMLNDISLDERYGNICGYTQANIENEFLPYLDGVDLDKLKKWYNGYNFLKDDMYNPFDILLFIDKNKIFKNYWFATGTPTFLIKLIEKNNYFLPKLLNIKVDEKLLDNFDIDNLDLEVILYQAGYLTIDEMIITQRESIEYKLKLPNKEVKQSLSDVVLDYLIKDRSNKLLNQNDIFRALQNANLENFKNTLISIFSSIPYTNFTKNNIQIYEGFYASIIYVYLQSLGIDIIGEDITNQGRIDLSVFIEDKIYIIEFKMNTNKDNALKQIKEKNYAQKYINDNKDIYLVGIEFDEKEKNIINFEYEPRQNSLKGTSKII